MDVVRETIDSDRTTLYFPRKEYSIDSKHDHRHIILPKLDSVQLKIFKKMLKISYRAKG